MGFPFEHGLVLTAVDHGSPCTVLNMTSHARVLYTCPARRHGAKGPLVKHPCGVAAKALDDAGHAYELKIVGGFKRIPFSRRGRRSEIVSLTGQEDVPLLLLDDGTAIQGSGPIADWAAANPAR